MEEIFDKISILTSRMTTKKYSTSFSSGIKFLHKKFHGSIYSIYGFVRFADEIVDTFHHYNQIELLNRFKEDTYLAITNEISLNPILNSFQKVVNQYHIDLELIDSFFHSMEMDLVRRTHDNRSYKKYIHGSAEAVGLMCLKVFCEGSQLLYDELKPYAINLGSAYQKINFLRDLSNDFNKLGRIYFPDIEIEKLGEKEKKMIEEDIEHEFKEGYKGIKQLPRSSKLGVYLSYLYFYSLLRKIKRVEVKQLLKKRIRISNFKKFILGLYAIVIYNLRFI